MIDHSPPQALRIESLLRDQAERIPQGVAIAAPGRAPLTYSRLLNQVEHVTKTLNAMGLARNDPVAVALPNGPEAAVCFLAVAAAFICAPLNPAHRANEFDFYLSDLQAKALVVQSGTESPAIAVAQKHSIPIIELSALAEAEAGIFSLRAESQRSASHGGFAQAEDIALILYTSGTTSRPKRVPLTHSNLLASAGNIAASLQLTEKDRCLNVMPLFHIHGLVGAILSSMMAGSIVICTSGFDAEQFFVWLNRYRPTWYTAVPTIHQTVLSRAPAHREMLRLCSLRFIRSSSAPLPLRAMQELEEVFHVPVIEAYGMTEASHQITSNPLPPGTRKARSVGLPSGTTVAVMDDGRDLVPPGKVGEIVIRGANVTSGYVNSPEANETGFKHGWLRTGDLGYLDEDGYLFLTGRLKEIINRGGEKLSPREIDEALLEHPDISEAAAFAVPHPTLGENIAAAVATRAGARLTEQIIREYLLERLAEFKVPNRIHLVDQIPKNATGKVRRAELAEKFSQEPKKELSLPKNKLETIAAGIYAEVLGFEKVSGDDNFFALGGDSLRATQVISRVRSLFQIELPIATVFRKSTPAQLAEEITQGLQETDPAILAEVLEGLKDLPEGLQI